MDIRIIISNVKPKIAQWGIDPKTNSGYNALINRVLTNFPDFKTFQYDPDAGTLEVVFEYKPPAILSNLGEVTTVDSPLR